MRISTVRIFIEHSINYYLSNRGPDEGRCENNGDGMNGVAIIPAEPKIPVLWMEMCDPEGRYCIRDAESGLNY